MYFFPFLFFFFFNDTATTEIYTLSLHDALPICRSSRGPPRGPPGPPASPRSTGASADRKSTRLNSSHRCISYAVVCLKKTNNIVQAQRDYAGQGPQRAHPLRPH